MVSVKIDWKVLPEPRRLTAAAKAVLDRLVAYADCAELTAQARAVRVTAVCGCGCRSVRLHSDAPALTRAAMARLSSTGRDDWFSIDHTSVRKTTPDDDLAPGRVPLLQVVVHVVQGSLHELEIF